MSSITLCRVSRLTSTKLSPSADPAEGSSLAFKCPNCGNRYGWKVSLTRHLREECNQLPKNQCKLCGRKFKQRSSYQRHMKSQHNCSVKIYGSRKELPQYHHQPRTRHPMQPPQLLQPQQQQSQSQHQPPTCVEPISQSALQFVFGGSEDLQIQTRTREEMFLNYSRSQLFTSPRFEPKTSPGELEFTPLLEKPELDASSPTTTDPFDYKTK